MLKTPKTFSSVILQDDPVNPERFLFKTQKKISILLSFFVCFFRVMIHVVAQCHEEGLEHYLRSYVKVKSPSSMRPYGSNSSL